MLVEFTGYKYYASLIMYFFMGQLQNLIIIISTILCNYEYKCVYSKGCNSIIVFVIAFMCQSI